MIGLIEKDIVLFDEIHFRVLARVRQRNGTLLNPPETDIQILTLMPDPMSNYGPDELLELAGGYEALCRKVFE